MGFLSSLFGVSDRTPSTQTVVQSSKVPSELAPYVNQISEEAQALYEGQVERGYNPYTGQTIAPLTVEEQEAMSGIAGLSGTTAPYIQEALGTYREGAEQFTGDTAQQYMSPYQQAVTDIELRESQNQFDTQVMPQFEAKAASMGAGSGLGTRAGVQAAELQRGQSQLLADIQAKGSQRAFQDARIGFEAQKARENQMAANVGRTGPALFQAGLAEQGALQGVGEAKRQLGQSALDESYAKFLSEENYPQQTLANYSNTIYGNPVLGTPSMTRSTSGTPGAASTAQQLLGLGLTGLNMYGAGTAGGQNFSFGNMASTMYNRPRAAGGQVGGGLPTIHRAHGGGGLGDDEQGFPMESDENIGRFIRETEDIPYRGQPTMSNSMQGPVNFYQGINKAINDLSVRSLESKNIATKLNTDVSAANIAANKRQTNLTDNFLNKKEAAIKRKSEAYPFASIQKGIAAGMKETTISEMFTQGIAVGGAELEKKANELANMVDALENKKFGAKSKQEAEQSARLLENLKGDANLQLKLLGQDTKTQLEILKLMAQGLNYKAALAKANKANAVKFTEPVRKTIELSSAKALGFTAKYDNQGNLLKVSGDKELNPKQVAALAKYEGDFLYAFGKLRDENVNEPTALARASKYAEEQSKGQPAASATPASVGQAPRVSVAPGNLPRRQLGGSTGLVVRPAVSVAP